MYLLHDENLTSWLSYLKCVTVVPYTIWHPRLYWYRIKHTCAIVGSTGCVARHRASSALLICLLGDTAFSHNNEPNSSRENCTVCYSVSTQNWYLHQHHFAHSDNYFLFGRHSQYSHSQLCCERGGISCCPLYFRKRSPIYFHFLLDEKNSRKVTIYINKLRFDWK